MQVTRTEHSDALALDTKDIQDLATRVRGVLIRPGDETYDEARRIFNGMIDRRPRLIVRCVDAAGVITAVNFARNHGLPLSVRGGGHNVAGSSVVDDGIVVDLSRCETSTLIPHGEPHGLEAERRGVIWTMPATRSAWPPLVDRSPRPESAV